jgi:hypothetical protein
MLPPLRNNQLTREATTASSRVFDSCFKGDWWFLITGPTTRMNPAFDIFQDVALMNIKDVVLAGMQEQQNRSKKVLGVWQSVYGTFQKWHDLLQLHPI